MFYEEIFVLKQLGNNARTTKQLQYSLDFFKMGKTKNMQLMPRAISKILKVLSLETMSFSHKAFFFHVLLAKCAVSTLFCSKHRLKHSSNKSFFQEGHLYNESNNFSLNNINLENVFGMIITCILGCKTNYAGSRS